ncbi:LysM domain-containing protein, partial [Planktotalea sp.]|uniref:LysM peptidoglycan-binding domain-containing protein n=1 Tax=Planktotalea sp. TaxID=2029877 RepID=UPI003299187C
EGSLLNSIVRRSMGQVGNAPALARIAAPTPRAAPKPKPQVVAAAPVKRVQAAALAPAPQKAVRQTAVQSTYVVASGDTLALIAIKLYGTALAIDDLLAQNPSLRSNPNSLRIGQVLQYAAN